MLEMERAELEDAKNAAKPELSKECKIFFITAQIKVRCAVNATKEDAENALRLMIAENHGEVLQIERVMGE
jgi:hypothetical protein